MHSFIAATAMGVPPRVPSVEIEGISMVRSRALDSAAFTKPTGVPITTAGRMPSLIRSQTTRRAEGAFPTPAGVVKVRHSRQSDGSVKSEIQAPDGIRIVRE